MCNGLTAGGTIGIAAIRYGEEFVAMTFRYDNLAPLQGASTWFDVVASATRLANRFGPDVCLEGNHINHDESQAIREIDYLIQHPRYHPAQLEEVKLSVGVDEAPMLDPASPVVMSGEHQLSLWGRPLASVPMLTRMMRYTWSRDAQRANEWLLRPSADSSCHIKFDSRTDRSATLTSAELDLDHEA
jgi:hypothetical protein